MRTFPRNDSQQNIPVLKATNKVTVIFTWNQHEQGKRTSYLCGLRILGKNSEQLRRYLPGVWKHSRYWTRPFTWCMDPGTEPGQVYLVHGSRYWTRPSLPGAGKHCRYWTRPFTWCMDPGTEPGLVYLVQGNVPGTEPGLVYLVQGNVPGTEPGPVYLVQGNSPGTEPGRPGPFSTSFPNRAKGDALTAAPTLHTTDSWFIWYTRIFFFFRLLQSERIWFFIKSGFWPSLSTHTNVASSQVLRTSPAQNLPQIHPLHTG